MTNKYYKQKKSIFVYAPPLPEAFKQLTRNPKTKGPTDGG